MQELSAGNVNLDNIFLNVPNIPSELIYGLWEVSVGKHSSGTSFIGLLASDLFFEQGFTFTFQILKKGRKELKKFIGYSVLGVIVTSSNE
jgi:hypothetical protein